MSKRKMDEHNNEATVAALRANLTEVEELLSLDPLNSAVQELKTQLTEALEMMSTETLEPGGDSRTEGTVKFYSQQKGMLFSVFSVST